MPSSAITAENNLVKAMPTAVPRKDYVKLTPAQRHQIGKKAAENGIAAALRFFQKNHPDLALTEPTAKNHYVEEQKRPRHSTDPELSELLQELSTKKKGRQPLIGQELVRQVRVYLNAV